MAKIKFVSAESVLATMMLDRSMPFTTRMKITEENTSRTRALIRKFLAIFLLSVIDHQSEQVIEAKENTGDHPEKHEPRLRMQPSIEPFPKEETQEYRNNEKPTDPEIG
jgi:hypothetical protein